MASGVSAGTISAARRGRPVSNGTLSKIANALRDAAVVPGVDILLEPEAPFSLNGSEAAKHA